jgi:transcriptional regulator with XRE-family HTH domain
VSNRTHITDGNFNPDGLTPAELTMQEFSRRLYRLMLAKGWTQAELSKQSDVSRDGISGYIRGNHMPTPRQLDKLANALGVKPDALLPNVVMTAIDEDTPSLELKVSTSDPTRSWLKVNRLVSTQTAGEIITLLNNDAKLLNEAPKARAK